MTGTISSGTMRLPMVELDGPQREVVKAALEGVGLTVTAS
jgi:dihydrodipicolinate synthase/N-acetylneuraminate lyase